MPLQSLPNKLPEEDRGIVLKYGGAMQSVAPPKGVDAEPLTLMSKTPSVWLIAFVPRTTKPSLPEEDGNPSTSIVGIQP